MCDEINLRLIFLYFSLKVVVEPFTLLVAYRYTPMGAQCSLDQIYKLTNLKPASCCVWGVGRALLCWKMTCLRLAEAINGRRNRVNSRT